MGLTYASGGNSSEIKTPDSINDLDWATFKIPKCEEQSFPSFSLCKIEQSQTNEIHGVRLAGLAWDRRDSSGLSVDESCTVYLNSGTFKNFGHDCASRAKSSGSPLFKKIGEKNCLLAIHAGCYSNAVPDKCESGITSKFYEEQTFNFAIPIERFKSALKSK